MTVLDARGAPTPVVATRLIPPASRMAPLTPEELQADIRQSDLLAEYGQAVDRESAREMLAARMARTQAPAPGSTPEAPAPSAPPPAAAAPLRPWRRSRAARWWARCRPPSGAQSAGRSFAACSAFSGPSLRAPRPGGPGGSRADPPRGDRPLTAPAPDAFTAEALLDAYPILSADERLEGFLMLGATEAADFFLALSAHDQADLLQELGPERSRPWMRLLAPDDAADVIQALPADGARRLPGAARRADARRGDRRSSPTPRTTPAAS